MGPDTQEQQNTSLSTGGASPVAQSKALITAVPPQPRYPHHLGLIGVSAALASMLRSHIPQLGIPQGPTGETESMLRLIYSHFQCDSNGASDKPGCSSISWRDAGTGIQDERALHLLWRLWFDVPTRDQEGSEG